MSPLWTNVFLDKCLAKDGNRNMRVLFFGRKEGGRGRRWAGMGKKHGNIPVRPLVAVTCMLPVMLHSFVCGDLS